jgi:hypothetical protein
VNAEQGAGNAERMSLPGTVTMWCSEAKPQETPVRHSQFPVPCSPVLAPDHTIRAAAGTANAMNPEAAGLCTPAVDCGFRASCLSVRWAQDESLQSCEAYQLSGRVDIELAVDAGPVRLYGFCADSQLNGDRVVGERAYDQLEDVAFAG